MLILNLHEEVEAKAPKRARSVKFTNSIQDDTPNKRKSLAIDDRSQAMRKSAKLEIKRNANEVIGDTKAAIKLDNKIAAQNSVAIDNEGLKKDNERLIQRIMVHLEDNKNLRSEVKALRELLNEGGINISHNVKSRALIKAPTSQSPTANQKLGYETRQTLKREASIDDDVTNKLNPNNNPHITKKLSGKFADKYLQSVDDNNEYTKHKTTRNVSIRAPLIIHFNYELAQHRMLYGKDTDTQTVFVTAEPNQNDSVLERQSYSSSHDLLMQTYITKINYLNKTANDFETKLKAKQIEIDEILKLEVKLRNELDSTKDELLLTSETFKIEMAAMEQNYNTKVAEFDKLNQIHNDKVKSYEDLTQNYNNKIKELDDLTQKYMNKVQEIDELTQKYKNKIEEFDELTQDNNKNDTKLRKFIAYLYSIEQHDIINQLKIIDEEIERTVVETST